MNLRGKENMERPDPFKDQDGGTPLSGHPNDPDRLELTTEGRNGLDEAVAQMSLPEIKDAIDDADHPLHEEAVRYNKQMADKLMPALQALQQKVTRQINLDKLFKGTAPQMFQGTALNNHGRSLASSLEGLIPNLPMNVEDRPDALRT